MVEPGYTPPPIETSSTPLLGGPGTVYTSAAVASKTIVSERSIPEAGVEGEDETPSKVMPAPVLMLCTSMLNHDWVVYLYGLDDATPAFACLPTGYITPSLTHTLTCALCFSIACRRVSRPCCALPDLKGLQSHEALC